MTNTYSPLKTAHIKDFQAVEDATIDFGDLTVLCGAGDVGKSTILRAIRAVCLNDGEDGDIRHGQKQCEVTLTLEDGTVISWWKDLKKGGCYSIDHFDETGQPYQPQVFLKTAGAVPEPVAAYLGVGSIEVDATTTLTPQLGDQFDEPFLIWETGSKRARIIGKATRLDMVISAQMQCKKELDKTKREGEEATNALVTAEEGLEALPDYEALGERVEEQKGNLQVIQDSIARAEKVRFLADRMAEVEARATAVDVGPLRERLDAAEERLELAERVQHLSQRIPELTKELQSLDKRHGDHEEALTSFQAQLEEACIEAGLCITCGGLLSHKECKSNAN